MDPFEWILAQADPAFDPGPSNPAGREARLAGMNLDPAHRQLLGARNGLYAFGRALHLFGDSDWLPYHDLTIRNRDAEWRRTYGEAVEGLVFFAEDLFGNLFAYRGRGVVFFDLEAAVADEVAADFSGWLEYVADDVDVTTGRSLALRWQAIHGPLPFDQRLCPKKPFLIGGDYTIENLFAIDQERGLALRAKIAQKLKDLPDGTEVEIRIDG